MYCKDLLVFLESYFQVMCEKMGGNLLEIEGQLEGQYITSQVKLFNSKLMPSESSLHERKTSPI